MNKRRNYSFKKVKEILDFVWNNPYSSFYRDKYESAGFKFKNIKNWNDFEKLPYLSKADIMRISPYDRCFVAQSEIEGVSASHGTTIGVPMVILRTKKPLPYAHMFYKVPLSLGVSKAMFLRWPFSYWFIYRHPDFSTPKIKKFLGNIYDLKMTARVVRELKIDALSATPTTLYEAIPYLEEERVLSQIKYVGTGGENCSEEKFNFFRQKFKNAKIKFSFAGSEGGHLAYSCKAYLNLYPVEFHPLFKFIHYETINPDSDSELIVTTLFKSEFPLIRYKTGDSVLFKNEQCECGEKIKMKVLGKISFYNVKIKDQFLSSQEIDKALEFIAKDLKSPDFRLEIKDLGLQTELKLKLILKKNRIDSISERKKEIEQVIMHNIKLFPSKESLFDFYHQKQIKWLKLEFVDSFPFTIKQRPIIFTQGQAVKRE